MSDSRAADEAIDWQPAQTYAGYLDLDRLLGAQHPRSGDRDEMLFIIVHQASELWLKLFLHEIGGAMQGIAADALDDALKVLARVGRVQAQLIEGWDVLATMTPAEYARLRPHLGTSSGFQSAQYRELEFRLGNKDARLAEVHRRDAGAYARLQTALREASLYDLALGLLARRGFAIPEAALARDWRAAYAPCADVEAAWLAIYRDPEKYWDLYDLAEKLVDLEDRLQQWRFRHWRTVQRIIGTKSGTGGSSGAPYLARALDLRLFPELWTLRARL